MGFFHYLNIIILLFQIVCLFLHYKTRQFRQEGKKREEREAFHFREEDFNYETK